MNTAGHQSDVSGHHAAGAPFLAHHDRSHGHQLVAGKLGMWLFLMTEILFFGGLFCAYAVYRGNHPEIFQLGAALLDKNLGAINTCVLLLSSLTMAWAVRAAQLGQSRRLAALLVATLLCAFAFLGIKYVEYKHKWEDGLLWASRFRPEAIRHTPDDETEHAPNAGVKGQLGADRAVSPAGRAATNTRADVPGAATSGGLPGTENLGPAEKQLLAERVGLFFSIYFAMTGLHALHVIGGIGAIGWLLRRAVRGHFGPEYYGPVDYVGLYWHLVDMIWIYLFPLLYLIH